MVTFSRGDIQFMLYNNRIAVCFFTTSLIHYCILKRQRYKFFLKVAENQSLPIVELLSSALYIDIKLLGLDWVYRSWYDTMLSSIQSFFNFKEIKLRNINPINRLKSLKKSIKGDKWQKKRDNLN